MECGFDGIEVDMGPHSILRQFLSPLTNYRTDQYGGSIQNRVRFPLSVVSAIRSRLGDKVPLGVCLCADELFPGGITVEKAAEAAEIVSSSGGVYYFQVGKFL